MVVETFGVAREILHRADIRAAVEQMRGERMPETVAGHTLRQDRALHCLLELASQGMLIRAGMRSGWNSSTPYTFRVRNAENSSGRSSGSCTEKPQGSPGASLHPIRPKKNRPGSREPRAGIAFGSDSDAAVKTLETSGVFGA